MIHPRDNREIIAQANYVRGFADALGNPRLVEASTNLERMARNTCGKGYVGCGGGPDCTGDHK